MFNKDWGTCSNIVNYIRFSHQHNWGESGHIWSFQKKAKLHFDYEQDIHAISKYHEENG